MLLNATRLKKWSAKLMIGFVVLGLMIRIAGIFIDFAWSKKDVDAFFKSQNVTPRYGFSSLDERKIHYVGTGNPHLPTVVFVHGSPGHWSAWIKYLGNPQLLERCRMIAFDRPGYGQSGRGRPERSLAKQAEAIRVVLDQLEIQEPIILVGHSYGGPVLARFAMDNPSRTAGLILIAPSIDPELEKTKWFQYPADWLLFSWIVPPDLVTSNREILPLKDELNKIRPRWQEIRCPTIVIQGERDNLVPAQNADFLKKMLPENLLTVTRRQDMNHFVPWTHPQVIIEAVISSLPPSKHAGYSY